MPKSKRLRMLVLMAIDVLTAALSGYIALLFRFDLRPSKIDSGYLTTFLVFLWIYLALTVLLYLFGHLYAIMWSQAGIREAVRIAVINGIIVMIYLAIITAFQASMPRSFYLLTWGLQTGFEYLIRFSYRMFGVVSSDVEARRSPGPRTLIAGAGSAGAQLGKEIQMSHMAKGNLICYVDADPLKKKTYLNGVPILGNRYDIEDICKSENIEQIFIAIPTASSKDRAAIADICRKTTAHVKILPGIYQLVNGEVTVSRLRDVQIEDLLGRATVKINLDEIAGYLQGKTILVTGGGGSIGSELCRQIAGHQPKLLIIFDIYENNAYDIQQELKELYPQLNLLVLIGSVRNVSRISQVMRDYRPEIVFHAAAHKHVPLMEDSPNEAIKNNVFGTLNTARAAAEYGVRRFVMISTDKAVNPTNIMGASKRLCEMIIQMMDKTSPGTDFVAVRFGNVLGSNGSVIPLFRTQIAAGGPVTVTDRNIVRYFMTIPEAVSLVLQAGAYAKGGEIFVLDMGEPVKILGLAENMIRLSGLTPYEDIDIVFTGLRPGEKLYEEMLMKEEGLKNTPSNLIHIGAPIQYDLEEFKKQLAHLQQLAAEEAGGDEMKKAVAEIVKTYHPEFRKNTVSAE